LDVYVQHYTLLMLFQLSFSNQIEVTISQTPLCQLQNDTFCPGV